LGGTELWDDAKTFNGDFVHLLLPKFLPKQVTYAVSADGVGLPAARSAAEVRKVVLLHAVA
jgi:hypothetical protein